jgi:hypothetical protein
MVGRLHNKARKEREWYELTRGAREQQDHAATEQRLREVMFARIVETPGMGFLRLECCGITRTFANVERGDTFRCSRCDEGRRSAIWPRFR